MKLLAFLLMSGVYLVSAQDAQWSPWSKWGAQCLQQRNGTRTRSRDCYNTLDGNRSTGCSGEYTSTSNCSTNICPRGLKMVLKPSEVQGSIHKERFFMCRYARHESERLEMEISTPSDTTRYGQSSDRSNSSRIENECGAVVKWSVLLNRGTTFVKCTVKDKGGHIMGELTSTVITGIAPVLHVHQLPDYVEENTTVSLHCRVTEGDPKPAVHWSRADSEPLSSNVIQMARGELRFKRVTKENIGIYICSAENFAGEGNASATLNIKSVPQVTLHPSLDQVRVLEGALVRFECNATGFPEPMVAWYRNEGDKPLLESPMSAVLELNVTQAEGGSYFCLATNDVGAVNAKIELIVGVTPENRTVYYPRIDTSDILLPPTIMLTPDTRQVVTPGSDVSVACTATGDEPITIQWRALKGELSSRANVSQGVLRISKIRYEDGGRYICTAKNKVDEQEQTAEIIVSPGNPEVYIKYSKLVVNAGDNATVTCHATSHSPIELQWSLQGRSMSPRATYTKQDCTLEQPMSPRTNHSTVSHLVLTRVDDTDAGMYVCHASNNDGDMQVSVNIVVTAGPLDADGNNNSVNGTVVLETVLLTTESDDPDTNTKPNDYFAYNNVTDPICKESQFQCANKSCVWKGSHCDGVDDCEDGSDETNCPTAPPGSLCRFNQFTCLSMKQCVNKVYKCDCEKDCEDGSDEIDCGQFNMTERCEASNQLKQQLIYKKIT